MDLPADMWNIVEQCMSPMEWALACGTLLAADVCGKPSKNLQDLTLQLQIHRWPLCRSLCINLEQLHKGVSVTPNQTMEISRAGSALPRLQCLHMIGRDQGPLTESSVEGMLLGILARHVLVLSLHVKVSPVPLDLPALQHLVLDLDTNSAKKDVWRTQAALVPAISTLKGLRTLYVRCVKTEITGPTDMTGCKHLQHVTLQGVRLKGTLALPGGCHLHAKCEPLYDCELSPTIADVVTGLTFRPGSNKKRIICLWGSLRLLPSHIKTQNLNQLRLILGKLDIYEMYWKKEEVPFRTRDELPFGQKLPVSFYASDMLGLEVLEVDVEGNLSVYIDPKLPLRTIVLIAAGTLKIDNMQLAFEMCLAPMATLKQLYFQWGTASESMPKYDAAAEPFKEADLGGTWRRVLENCVTQPALEEQDCWRAQMPNGFYPGNLQDCYCGACLECLARAGVPILCDKAWTRNGFKEHLRPKCGGKPRSHPSLWERVRKWKI